MTELISVCKCRDMLESVKSGQPLLTCCPDKCSHLSLNDGYEHCGMGGINDCHTEAMSPAQLCAALR